MYRFFWSFFFLVICQLSLSQKLVEKEIVNPETKFIAIDASNCFLVTIATHESKQMKVEASMEGEYAQNLSIQLEEQGSNILIGSDFLPSFNAPNDKLSAHKVISISLSVTLPEYMRVKLYGTNSNVYAKGKFNNLSITLADGSCTLQKITQNTAVKTQKGEIIVYNASGIVEAKSDYGKIAQGNIPHGDSYYSLNTIEGNISVNITKNE